MTIQSMKTPIFLDVVIPSIVDCVSLMPLCSVLYSSQDGSSFYHTLLRNSTHYTVRMSCGGSKNFLSGGRQLALSSFIANAHNEQYAFYIGKSGLLKKL